MTVLLRTLAERSKFGFGKYKTLMVREVLNMGVEGQSYVVWAYYYNDMLSFHDDILTEVGITEELRIEKPGKNPSMIREWNKTLTDDERLSMWRNKKRTNKGKVAASKAANSYNNSAGALQNANHGKRKLK